MKLAYGSMEHIIRLGEGYVSELIIENKKMFFEMVNNIVMQTEGLPGNCVLSIADRPVEFSKYADVIVQLAPFQINKKSLLTKLYATIEQKAIQSEHYMKTAELLGNMESYIFSLVDDLPFDITCKKIAIGPIIRAISPEIDESEKTTLEKLFAYMELVRELDRDRLFITINLRTYFSDEDLERFIESVTLHDFKVLLLENVSFHPLKSTKRYVIDDDLCEF